MGKMFNVGKIVNTHGLMGEVRVISRTDFADERYRVGNKIFLYLKNENTPIELTIRSHRVHKNFDLLTFEGYNGINQVEKMKEGILKVPEEALSELEENAYYFHEIIGCNVRTLDGLVLGEITEILTPGANDVWVVKPERGKEMLIPYIADVVKKIDIANKDIVIEPLEGLLD
ncbi:16S rRNA-processing protein RimM [Listeria fleischmannii subsp. coloradonensis]|uniref:ribosome maturation factor RimM n=1 Tax=Listeria fleischmannii TaxID=1069827 RepID=UPI000254F61A|nr:ribosome maturation factor RimM [Listeria fleischmannii]EIA20778.1 16S rRNA-processing protein RimM [Listeria fleischmannii subsp. coloradonensis]